MMDQGDSAGSINAPNPTCEYDVFLSFKGEARRNGFVDHLYHALSRAKINTYSGNIFERDYQSSSCVLKAIEEARTSIVVFSKNFASSSRCLDELVKILECKKRMNQQVLPIFYKVDQADVRYQRNSYGKAMAELEERFGKDSEKVQKWRSALCEATSLPGFVVQDDRYVKEFTQGIVGWVKHSVQRDPVFLTHRKQETNNFTRFLCYALRWEGFDTFMNHEILDAGSQISELMKAIEESRLSIVVFSKNYANSLQCLDELAKIHECMRLKKQRVWPIFYKVEPSDVRYQDNFFGKAMAVHEDRFGKDSEKIQKWKSALFEVANLRGDHFETGYQHITIKKIVKSLNIFFARHYVFLSFRGKDTRYTFIGHLYDALSEKQINTFMDDETLRGGDQMSSIMKEIEEARISIVVLSENFAHSSWCLDELVKVVECMKTKGQLVLPIYFKVDLLDVRHQRNSFEKGMAQQERWWGKESKKVQEWRSALSDITYLRGFHFNSGPEPEFIEMIVERVNGHCDQYLNSLVSTKSWLNCRL